MDVDKLPNRRQVNKKALQLAIEKTCYSLYRPTVPVTQYCPLRSSTVDDPSHLKGHATFY